MRRFAQLVFASCAALALAGCGSKSTKSGDTVAADTVEMPAEEAMSDVTGVPSDMAATDAAPDAQAGDIADMSSNGASPASHQP